MEWDSDQDASTGVHIDRDVNVSQPINSAIQPTPQLGNRSCSLTDIHLINRIAACDRKAFELLYNRYAARIQAFLNRRLGSSELNEDIVNEVMIVIWQQASEFQPTFRFSTWVFGIARRKALEAYRRTSRVPPEPPSTWTNGCEEEDLEDIALEAERLERIQNALNRLPPDQRTALTLAFYYNYSQQEIATRTGYPVSTIKSQLRQGLQRLRIVLEQL